MARKQTRQDAEIDVVDWLRKQTPEDKAERMVAELQTFGLTA